MDALAADDVLVAALGRADTHLLDDDLTWVDANGRMFDKLQVAEHRPTPFLDRGELEVHRYRPLATARVENGKHHVLRIWVERADGWKLIVWHEVSQEVPHAPHGPPPARSTIIRASRCPTHRATNTSATASPPGRGWSAR